jgi:zinc-binding alcohol dehydrogenase family protein
MILGFDAAGIVEAVGPEVTLFAPGDEVYYAGTIVRPGTNAELHAVDERIVGRKPQSLGWAESAALPLTALTAWEILFDRLRVGRNADSTKSILIVNGAGGVGSILVQLARQLTGLHVIATASRAETVEWVEGLGAHQVISHHKPLDEELARLGVPSVDYVASLAASESNLAQFAKIIAPRGTLCLIDDVRAFDIVSLRQKSITVAWEGVFTRSIYKTDDMIEQHNILNDVAQLINQGVLRGTLTRILGPIDAANLKAAHRLVEGGQMIGKVALAGFPPPM